MAAPPPEAAARARAFLQAFAAAAATAPARPPRDEPPAAGWAAACRRRRRRSGGSGSGGGGRGARRRRRRGGARRQRRAAVEEMAPETSARAAAVATARRRRTRGAFRTGGAPSAAFFGVSGASATRAMQSTRLFTRPRPGRARSALRRNSATAKAAADAARRLREGAAPRGRARRPRVGLPLGAAGGTEAGAELRLASTRPTFSPSPKPTTMRRNRAHDASLHAPPGRDGSRRQEDGPARASSARCRRR